ncbi:hypothetical protein [Taibaiella chishuiensis]|uniref:Uncharacterized protein n=1 Tax=Taibaiella chishuiensis TaxID=1434707 RepID=A0A2P8D0P9_9BACT|nr:hypothetical protein [Taibaiella chishuiensis]PSK90793.1 hypothetical protein B0I18_107205 [Taibaiella chishuiensis]
MLEQITWKTYLTVVLIAIIIYYLFIGFLHRESIIKMIRKRQGQNYENEDEVITGFSSFDELEELVNDIRHSILEKAGTEVSKDELLDQLCNRLTHYGGLRQPAYRIAITNFIIQNAETICEISFTKDELEAAWDRLIS